MAETAKSGETDQSQSGTQSSKAADRREKEALDAKDSEIIPSRPKAGRFSRSSIFMPASKARKS